MSLQDDFWGQGCFCISSIVQCYGSKLVLIHVSLFTNSMQFCVVSSRTDKRIFKPCTLDWTWHAKIEVFWSVLSYYCNISDVLHKKFVITLLFCLLFFFFFLVWLTCRVKNSIKIEDINEDNLNHCFADYISLEIFMYEYILGLYCKFPLHYPNCTQPVINNK